jgi:hypothetical protein
MDEFGAVKAHRITGFRAWKSVNTNVRGFHSRGGDFAQELQLCQRYFEKSYNINDSVGTATQNGMEGSTLNEGSLHNRSNSVSFKINKRTTPTVTTYDKNGTAGNALFINNSNTESVSATGTRWLNESSFSIVSANPNYSIHLHYTADAEL